MLLPAGLLLRLLEFGTLVAPVFSLQFLATSPQQCSPFLLSFTGLAYHPSGAPASLAIIPFNSTATVIPLQNINFSAGIALNFVPLIAGSQFIVSLDDANGNNIINTSDVLSVTSSPNNNNNSTCISGSNPPSIFTLPTLELYQCQNFTINYNTTVVSRAPKVRLYNPSGHSLILNVTSDNTISGVATYLMAFASRRVIILAIDSGKGITETTQLLSVLGTSSSSSACLLPDLTEGPSSISTISSNNIAEPLVSTPRNIAIISASVGGAAVLFSICLTIFFIRDRRKYQRQQFDASDSSSSNFHDEKRRTIFLGDSYPTGFVKTPIDTPDLSSEKGYYDSISLASWSHEVSDDQYSPPSSEAKQSPQDPTNRSSPDSSAVPQLTGPTLLPPPTITLLPPPTITRSFSSRYLRAPSDVPADLNSRCSTDSYYPSVYEGGLKNPLPAVTARSLNHRGSFKLPASPRDGLRGNTSRAASRAASRRSVISASPITKEWSGRTFVR